jgi:hypothetical protein
MRLKAGNLSLNPQTQLSALKNPASPRRCPTPCVLLKGVNTLIDLLFILLAATSGLSALLLLAELWDSAR